MTGVSLVILQAGAQPAPRAELQTAFMFVMLVVLGAIFFLWLIYSRFSRPP
ncbi:MAG: hypothetical protein K6U89_17410 [Chloroflexi bacterium]|jgi:hypothetical protein|nr:hypothetical protein [Chloroflexota bacterium]